MYVAKRDGLVVVELEEEFDVLRRHIARCGGRSVHAA